MKTQKELDKLKSEYETLATKLNELSEDELNMVTGGCGTDDALGHRVSIRGIGTIGENPQPLYVIDGNNVGNINPQDIETIDVLKNCKGN